METVYVEQESVQLWRSKVGANPIQRLCRTGLAEPGYTEGSIARVSFLGFSRLGPRISADAGRG